MEYARPNRVEDALALLAQGKWSVLAGGTDVYPGLGDGVVTAPTLDITAIEELRQIRREGGHWSIGATATWSDLVAADLPPAFDGLKLAALEVGSVQIQNRATIAGNICNASPAADGVPPLLTLNALVETASAEGTRRLALADFIRGNRKTALEPGEIVTRILIPKSAAAGRSSFLKLGSRKYLVISISMVAARLVFDETGRVSGAAVSVGACSLVAQRLAALEEALLGASTLEQMTGMVAPEHLAPLRPIDDLRSTAGYRRQASLELVRRAIARAAGAGR